MLRHYITVTLRNLLKHKLISAINLFGLTMGLTCCLLILAYILHETSYDRTPPTASRIYRVTRNFYDPSGATTLELSAVAPVIGPLLQSDFPQIEKMAIILSGGSMVTRYEDKILTQDSLAFADGSFLDLFGVRVLSGDARTALQEPRTIMLEQRTARKYFGTADPLNKEVKLDGNLLCKVTGVYQGLPENSHLHPAMLISYPTLKDPLLYGEEAMRTSWSSNSFHTYLQLPAGYDAAQLEAQFPAFLDRHMPQPKRATDFVQPSKMTSLQLQRLTDVHLTSHRADELEANGDITRVYIFSIIALFVLLIACINYMNLSTARAALRAKEVGVRKVIGARRSEIILQFLGESVLITVLATVLAVGCALLALPWLSRLAGTALHPELLLRGPVLAALLALPLVVGVLSGLYPALYMSSFQPQQILKGFLKNSGGLTFRRALVVVQFVVSIGLLVGTAIVMLQVRYLQQTPLGYNREQLLTMTYPPALTPQYEAFRQALQQQPSVLNAGRSSRIPTGRLLDASDAAAVIGDSLRPTAASIKFVSIDDQFLPTYGIKLAAGRNFSPAFPTDTTGFILNASAVRMVGWSSPAAAVGQAFRYGGVMGRVVGVVEDFHFESLHQPIVPLVMFLSTVTSRSSYNLLTVKIAGANVPAALSHLESTWKQFLPEQPFGYTFLDESYNRLYQAEQRQSTLFALFAGIAIFIACLGLFGLSAFAITQRVKEIGIRKVLGASTSAIVVLLSGDFLKLVGVAALLALPLSWYLMHRWLQDFAYRIAMPWWVFPLAGLAAVLIALVTIVSQTVSVARANPVKSLRTE
ncbi:ABC transporter permease [Hymenobacter cellulosilyticus]|uniref:ABC transporter permease n=1 Tax=Hymenobacter cellulosilyticus TaxID=2932248 RepID=A0A8T9Q1D4_9BACT|nr:ABC transporter permease [Hymenobacter cellulosilyticus]UOQ70835.1 ABC transporter permease [Hymenobacter cellulosilyticus]